MKISFVVPCYRSEKTLRVVVSEITDKMREMNQDDYEIILIKPF